jgi:hypothetical protein
VHAFQSISVFYSFELENFMDMILPAKKIGTLPVFRWMPTAYEWYVIEMLGDVGWAVWVARHYSVIIYFGLIVPVGVLVMGVTHISLYIRLTREGRISYSEGLRLRKEEVRRRLEERQQLITSNN